MKLKKLDNDDVQVAVVEFDTEGIAKVHPSWLVAGDGADKPTACYWPRDTAGEAMVLKPFKGPKEKFDLHVCKSFKLCGEYTAVLCTLSCNI